MAASASVSVHSTSMYSIGNQIGSKVRTIALMGKPTIDIQLDNPHGPRGSYVTSYSTMDKLEGTVSITARDDTRFDDIEIAFVGIAKTCVDRLTSTPTISGRTEATHRFLKLTQPIDPSSLPQPRIAEAGKTYTFPFTFMVPEQLLPRACTHRTVSDHVRQLHLQLPPSLGDAELAGHSGVLLDDLAPDMAKITYGIKVRVTQVREADSAVIVLADKMKKVRVKPAFEEQPPLNVDPNDDEYCVRQKKTIKKGMFKGKLGTLVMESVQPKALRIPGARSDSKNCPITTMGKVLLRFDPADESNPPPRLGSLTTKMKVSTFYASGPRVNLPSRTIMGIDLSQGLYSEHVQLSSMCVASAQWQKHTSEPERRSEPQSPCSLDRRDSGISDCSIDGTTIGIPCPSKHYHGKTFYTAKIIVPITLPNNKNFVPTFHSCLISRIYSLNLNLTAQAPGVSDPSLTLKVPVQICADGSATGNENARARSVEQVAIEDVEDMWRPRSVAPPVQMVGMMGLERGGDAPPEYAPFAPGAGVSVAG